MCSAIESITIPKYVEEIGDSAFYGCHSLREVSFENGSRLKTIGALAFAQSGIESIKLPKSVKCVAHNVFMNTSVEKSMKPVVERLRDKEKQAIARVFR